MDELFCESVFKRRFVEQTGQFKKDEVPEVYKAIVEVLKETIGLATAQKEVLELRDWIARLDGASFNVELSQLISTIYGNFVDTRLEFSQENLIVLVSNIHKFINSACSTAKASRTKEALDFPTSVLSTFLFQKKPISFLPKRALSIIKSWCYASRHFNPYSLSLAAQKKIFLENFYHEHSTKSGTHLKKEEIPSHVEAARTDGKDNGKVNIFYMTRGLLCQHVRPGGFIGDYYAYETETPDRLGFSEKVKTDKGIESRIKVRLLYEGGNYSAASIAEKVTDSWSIEGEKIECTGGGTQFFISLTPEEKKKKLRILLEGDEEYIEALKKIAEKNEIECIELKDPTPAIISPKPDILLNTHDLDALFDLLTSSYNLNNYQMLQAVLKKCIEHENLKDNNSIHRLKCILACLYALHGRNSDADNEAKNSIVALSSSGNSMDKQLAFLTRFHIARSYLKPLEAISRLETLIKELDRPEIHAIFNNSDITEYRVLLTMEMASQYNREAAQYSTEVTYEDFDENGKKSASKFDYAKRSMSLLKEMQIDILPIQEKIIALMEKGYAVRRPENVQDFNEGLAALEAAESLLQNEISAATVKEYSKLALKELKLQLLGVKLMIGLCCIRFKNGYEQVTLPAGETIIPAAYLQNLYATELSLLPPVQTTLLFKRWIGLNPNNLFIDGWYQFNPNDPLQGLQLIEWFRQYIPLDIKKYIHDLEENKIEQLELGFLSAAPPCGVTDEDFIDFCDALAKNTSLKSLHLRKPADEKTNVNYGKNRMHYLFDALSKAQKNGQKLNYLSYVNARFRTEEEYTSCLQYLSANESIIILQPSLYDWKDVNRFQQFAEIVEKHPSLIALSPEILECPGGGEILSSACLKSKTIRYVYPYSKNLPPGDTKYENQEILRQLSSELEKKYNNSTKQEEAEKIRLPGAGAYNNLSCA